MTNRIWSKVILIGDSLTQHSFNVDQGCWGSMLAHSLQRISDVVSRGFSGYTTRSIRKILPDLLTKDDCSKAACVIILLGSNDCADNSSIQHVPKEFTKANLTAIIDILISQDIQTDKIIMMTPPCYFHEDFKAASDHIVPMRSPDEYGLVVKQVANEKNIMCIDLNEITKKHPNSRSLFHDGLHFNRSGAQVVYDALWPSVVDRIIAFYGHFEPKFPTWDEIEKKSYRLKSVNP